MIVFLLGYMGSGKSTVGKKLARCLNWDYIDLDRAIEEKENRTIATIFRENGESYFRKIEAETIRNILPDKDSVISCGGGTPCYHDNLDFMNKNGYTVYLRLTPAALRSRLEGSGEERPLLKDLQDEKLIDYLEKSVSEREKWYNGAKVIVDGLNLDVNQLCSLVRAQTPYNPL